MTVTVWRLAKRRHRATAFLGEGARLYGGRWNSPGVAVVYTAGNLSLAALEMLVHLEAQHLFRNYLAWPVQFDERLVQAVNPDDLPKRWRADPSPVRLRKLGDAWARAETSAVLRVPSAIVEAEYNYLLNPSHPDFGEIEIGSARSFRFDARLLKES